MDPHVYRPLDQVQARQRLGVESDAFVIGFSCANLATPNKGAGPLIEALQTLVGQVDFTLLACGDNRLPDVAGRFTTRACGYISSAEQMATFYSACDVVAVPGRFESFGLAALESAACGVSTVAYRTGGLVDVVIHGGTGLLVDDVGSVTGLAEALRWIGRHPADRRAMGRAAPSGSSGSSPVTTWLASTWHFPGRCWRKR